MNWETIEPGLQALLARLTGLPVLWENAPREFVTGGGTVLLSAFGFASQGTDASTWSRVPGTGGWGAEWVTDPWASTSDLLEEAVHGPREFTLRCKIETYDHSPGSAAHVYLAKIRDRIQWYSSWDALRGLNLAFQSVEAMTTLDPTYDDHVFSAGVIDVRLNATSYENDSSNRIPSIDTVIIKR